MSVHGGTGGGQQFEGQDGRTGELIGGNAPSQNSFKLVNVSDGNILDGVVHGGIERQDAAKSPQRLKIISNAVEDQGEVSSTILRC